MGVFHLVPNSIFEDCSCWSKKCFHSYKGNKPYNHTHYQYNDSMRVLCIADDRMKGLEEFVCPKPPGTFLHPPGFTWQLHLSSSTMKPHVMCCFMHFFFTQNLHVLIWCVFKVSAWVTDPCLLRRPLRQKSALSKTSFCPGNRHCTERKIGGKRPSDSPTRIFSLFNLWFPD